MPTAENSARVACLCESRRILCSLGVGSRRTTAAPRRIAQSFTSHCDGRRSRGSCSHRAGAADMAVATLSQQGIFCRFPTYSFSYAEAAEDAVEQVAGVDGADHLAELVERPAQFQGEQFGRVLEQGRRVGPAE